MEHREEDPVERERPRPPRQASFLLTKRRDSRSGFPGSESVATGSAMFQDTFLLSFSNPRPSSQIVCPASSLVGRLSPSLHVSPSLFWSICPRSRIQLRRKGRAGKRKEPRSQGSRSLLSPTATSTSLPLATGEGKRGARSFFFSGLDDSSLTGLVFRPALVCPFGQQKDAQRGDQLRHKEIHKEGEKADDKGEKRKDLQEEPRGQTPFPLSDLSKIKYSDIANSHTREDQAVDSRNPLAVAGLHSSFGRPSPPSPLRRSSLSQTKGMT